MFEQYGGRLLVAVIAVAGVTGHLHDLDGLLEAMHKGAHGEDMNLRKGVCAVVALYWYYVIAAAMPFAAQFSYFVGSCSVICMALGLLLSVRPRAVEPSIPFIKHKGEIVLDHYLWLNEKPYSLCSD